MVFLHFEKQALNYSLAQPSLAKSASTDVLMLKHSPPIAEGTQFSCGPKYHIKNVPSQQ